MKIFMRHGLLAIAALLAAGAFIDQRQGRIISAVMSAVGTSVAALAWVSMGRRGEVSSKAEPSRGWTPPTGYLLLVAMGSIVATVLAVFLLLDARADPARDMPLSAIWSGLGAIAGIAVAAFSLISLVLGLSLRLHVTGWVEHAARDWFIEARLEGSEDE